MPAISVAVEPMSAAKTLHRRLAEVRRQGFLESFAFELEHPHEPVELFLAPLHGAGSAAVVGGPDSGDYSGHVDRSEVDVGLVVGRR